MHRHLSLITFMYLQHRELRNAIEKHPGVVWKWRIVGAKFGDETKGDTCPQFGSEACFLSLNH